MFDERPASIHLERVTKRFGSLEALREVDLHVRGGSLTALVGPSGCGKSTLLRVIAGFEWPDGGSVHIGGVDVTHAPLRDRQTGFVFQTYALFPHLTVARNIAFPLEVRNADPRAIAARVEELLALVRLPGLGSRRPHQLSGGQRQRVALARALAASPAVLLLDEPFAALDHNVRRELRSWLRALHDAVHVTTILVTHDAEEAMEIADSVVLLREGTIEQAGTPQALYDRPVSDFAREFLGPASRLRIGDDVRYVRPHEVRIEAAPFNGSVRARIARVTHLGSRVRHRVVFDDGGAVDADLAPHLAIFAHDAVVYAGTHGTPETLGAAS